MKSWQVKLLQLYVLTFSYVFPFKQLFLIFNNFFHNIFFPEAISSHFYLFIYYRHSSLILCVGLFVLGFAQFFPLVSLVIFFYLIPAISLKIICRKYLKSGMNATFTEDTLICYWSGFQCLPEQNIYQIFSQNRISQSKFKNLDSQTIWN